VAAGAKSIRWPTASNTNNFLKLIGISIPFSATHSCKSRLII
jgi:hypothetical protein